MRNFRKPKTLKEKLIERVKKMRERRNMLDKNASKYINDNEKSLAAICIAKRNTFDIIINDLQRLIN